MSEENIEKLTKSSNNFATTFDHHVLPDINYNENVLINNNISIRKKTINRHIYQIQSPWLRNLNTHFTLNNCLCGSVNLTKNADPDKYKYSGYNIRFDYRLDFSFTGGSMRKKVIIFGADIC